MGRRPRPLPIRPEIQDKVVPDQLYLVLFKPPGEKENYPPHAFAYVREEERELKLAFLLSHGFKCVKREYRLAR
jgi:hypothetical protein